MECVTFHYSQRNMDKVPYLFAMIFPDSKIAESITLGCTELVYVINMIHEILL